MFLLSWVGYSEPHFEGQQYILEEGEYPQSSDWGGAGSRILSLRPVCTVRVAAADAKRQYETLTLVYDPSAFKSQRL